MGTLFDRLGLAPGGKPSEDLARRAAEAASRLEAGEPASSIANGLGLDAGPFVGLVALDALGGPDAGPGLVQSTPRRPALGRHLDDAALGELFPAASRPGRLALAAGLLQIHDHWEASHEAAQKAEDLGERAVSAYWHGIAHRREPDAGNAAYWFRRVGRHRVFDDLAASADGLLRGDEAMRARLLPRGAWDPQAFIAFCGSGRGTQAELARAIQRVEMMLLLDASIPA
jgi:hypothetical protein